MRAQLTFAKLGFILFLLFLSLFAIVGAAEGQDYNRREWRHWVDEDRDCQDARQEVLIAESLEPVVLDRRGCRVVSGLWHDPFTGRTFTNPRQLDVDHFVPLKHAHDAGGWAWSREKKRAYANTLSDTLHLVAVYRGANRSKGSKAPHEWMPDNPLYRCDYLRAWVGIKHRWDLAYAAEEALYIVRALGACEAGETP